MSATVTPLPIWKRDSTPVEWLQELTAMAMAHPERFTRMVFACEEDIAEGQTKLREYRYGCNGTYAVGLHEFAKSDLMTSMRE